MAYRNGRSSQNNRYASHANEHGLHTVFVHLTPQFTGRWGRGRYSGGLGALEQYFGREMRLGYLEMDERQRPTLRFPDRNVVIPLHPRDSMTSVEACGFYHERRALQLGKKDMQPASINGQLITPGVVRVWWEAMY